MVLVRVVHKTVNENVREGWKKRWTKCVTPSPQSATTPSTTVPGGILSRQWGPITGGASTTDASVRYTFHVPLRDGAGTPVLAAADGNDVSTVNDSSLVVTYTPVARTTCPPACGAAPQ